MRVKLTYFKKSGKYYTDGEYLSQLEYGHEVREEVEHMRTIGKLPGITSGKSFIIHIAGAEDEIAPILLMPLDYGDD